MTSTANPSDIARVIQARVAELRAQIQLRASEETQLRLRLDILASESLQDEVRLKELLSVLDTAGVVDPSVGPDGVTTESGAGGSGVEGIDVDQLKEHLHAWARTRSGSFTLSDAAVEVVRQFGGAKDQHYHRVRRVLGNAPFAKDDKKSRGYYTLVAGISSTPDEAEQHRDLPE